MSSGASSQLRLSGRCRVTEHDTGAVEHQHATAGRRQLCQQHLVRHERTSSRQPFTERPGRMLRIGRELGLERMLQLTLEHQEAPIPNADRATSRRPE